MASLLARALALCNSATPERGVARLFLTLLVYQESEVKNVLFQIRKDREQIVAIEPVVETSDRGLRKRTD